MTFTLILATGQRISDWPDILNENFRQMAGGFQAVAAQTANFTVWSDDVAGAPRGIYLCSNTIAATMPAANSTDAAAGRVVTIKNNGSGTVTVTPDGSDTVDGAASLALAAGDAATLVSDGTSDWVII